MEKEDRRKRGASMTDSRSYPEHADLRQDAATEREFLEDNIATVAFHLGQPGAKLSVRSDKDALMVDPGEVLKEISRRLTVDPAQGSVDCGAVYEECAKIADQVAINAERRAAGYPPQSQAEMAAYDKMEGAKQVADRIRDRALSLTSTHRVGEA